MALGFFVAGVQLFPRLGEQRVIVKVAERLRELESTEKIALWHYCDPSLVFNYGKPIQMVDSLCNNPIFPGSLDLARTHGRFICPMKQEQVDLMSQDPNLRLDVLESITSFDLHGMKPRTVHLVAVSPAETAVAADAHSDPNCPTCRQLVQPFTGSTQASKPSPELR
jgi:hypothetical protein